MADQVLHYAGKLTRLGSDPPRADLRRRPLGGGQRREGEICSGCDGKDAVFRLERPVMVRLCECGEVVYRAGSAVPALHDRDGGRRGD